MIPPEHQHVLTYLFIFVGVLMMTIIGTLILSQLKKQKKASLSTAAKAAEVPALQSDSIDEGLKAFAAVAEKFVPPPVETDVQLVSALQQTEKNFFGRLKAAFSSGGDGNAAMEQIEEVLYTSDLGPKTVTSLLEDLQSRLGRKELKDVSQLRSALRETLLGIFGKATSSGDLRSSSQGPTVIMIVGVNGAGKTTTIGKLSAQFAEQGKKVLVAAGDTFRAAAGAQLKIWSERAQVEIFFPEGVSDPAAVAFDAVSKASAQGFDVVLIDTAGRLHTQANLMEELKKVKRVLQKKDQAIPHEILIVLDANSGQNALHQAREFNNALGLTGVVLTKMDGTAKGGVAVGLVDELHVPVKFIGVGERVRDLRTFSANEYVDAILGH